MAVNNDTPECNRVKPYGSTLKDKIYYVLEYSTADYSFIGIFTNLLTVLVGAEYLWNKAVDYSLDRQRQNGIKYPWVGIIHLEDVIDLVVKEAKRLVGEK